MKPVLKSVLIAALFAFATPALALEPINKEKHINHTLLQGFIADNIDKNCDLVSARTLRALSELNSLKNYALDKGYTRTEVKDFVTSKTEKARGKAEALAWLKTNGAVAGDQASYCKIAKAEIAKDSLIGQLLRDDG